MKPATGSKKIKIAFLIGQLGYGGSERQLYNILKHLDPKTYQSLVIVFNPSPNETFEEPLRMQGVKVHHVPQSFKFVLKRARYVYQIVRKFSPDIVHSWSFYDNVYAGVSGRLAGSPVRFGSLRNSINLTSFRNSSGLLRWLSLNSTSTLTVNANFIVEELRQMGYPQECVRLLPNCVERVHALPKPDLNAFGINAQQPLIGTVGNLRPVKNQAIFVEGMAKVLQKIPEFRGVIIGEQIPGEGDLVLKLEKQIQDYGLRGKVMLLGFRADVPALMQRLSIFCLTSDSEGTPNTILEAMAASRAVVATNVGGVPEVVVDGISGLLINPGDSDALASKLIELIENPGLREQMGQAGKQIVERDFSCQEAVSKLTSLYQGSLSNRYKTK